MNILVHHKVIVEGRRWVGGERRGGRWGVGAAYSHFSSIFRALTLPTVQ